MSKSTLFDIIFFIEKRKVELCKLVFLYAVLSSV